MKLLLRLGVEHLPNMSQAWGPIAVTLEERKKKKTLYDSMIIINLRTVAVDRVKEGPDFWS